MSTQLHAVPDPTWTCDGCDEPPEDPWAPTPRPTRNNGTPAGGQQQWWDRARWNGADLMRHAFPPREYLAGDILPANSLAVLAGAKSIGKTWWSYDLALAIALGGKAWGSVPVPQGDVLYFALEEPADQLQDRARFILGPDRSCVDLSRLEIQVQIDSTAHIGEITREWAGDVPRPKLVVIDVLVRPPSSDKDRYAVEYAFSKNLLNLARALRVTILPVVHTNQGKHDDDFTYKVQGSNGLIAPADAVMVLERHRGSDMGTLAITGKSVRERTDIGFKMISGRAWQAHDGILLDPNLGDLSQRILTALNDHPIGATPAKIAEDIGVDNKVVGTRLAELYASERCGKLERGLYVPVAFHTTTPENTETQETETPTPLLSGVSGNSGVPL